MDDNAIIDLHLALADKILCSMAEQKTAKCIWNTLAKVNKAKLLHNKIFLKRRLYSVQMVETISMTDYINTLKTFFLQLTMLGHKIEKIEHAKLLFQSSPDWYDQIIINFTNNIRTEYLVFDDVIASVLEEVGRCKNNKDRQESLQQAETLIMVRRKSVERGFSAW